MMKQTREAKKTINNDEQQQNELAHEAQGGRKRHLFVIFVGAENRRKTGRSHGKKRLLQKYKISEEKGGRQWQYVTIAIIWLADIAKSLIMNENY